VVPLIGSGNGTSATVQSPFSNGTGLPYPLVESFFFFSPITGPPHGFFPPDRPFWIAAAIVSSTIGMHYPIATPLFLSVVFFPPTNFFFFFFLGLFFFLCPVANYYRRRSALPYSLQKSRRPAIEILFISPSPSFFGSRKSSLFLLGPSRQNSLGDRNDSSAR